MEERWWRVWNAGPGRDAAGLDLFWLELRLEIERELGRAEELFAERADFFLQEVQLLQRGLAELEAFSAEREEWERCALIRDERARLDELVRGPAPRKKVGPNF